MARAAARSAAPAAKASAPKAQRLATPAPAAVESRLGGGGAPLPLTTRQRMERSFGRSFGDVQVHTGGGAGSLALSQGAQAFTVGKRIAFAPGHFAPGTESGDGLIAHELAHVVQQDGGAAASQAVHARGPASNPGEPAEIEAEAASSRVLRGEPARVAAGGHACTTRHRLMRRALVAPVPLPVTAKTPLDDEDAQAIEVAEDVVEERKRRPPPAAPGAPPPQAPAIAEPKPAGAAAAPAPAPAATPATPVAPLVPAAPAAVAVAAGPAAAPGTAAAPPTAAPAGPAAAAGAAAGAPAAAPAPAGAPAAMGGEEAAVAPAGAAKAPAAKPGEKPEAAEAAPSPQDDPAFKAVARHVAGAASAQKKHDPASAKAGAAHAAAEGPSNDVSSQAQAKHVEKMDAQKPKPFDRAAFKKALSEKIASIAPKTLEEADDFKSKNRVGELKGDLAGKVDASKQEAAGPIQTTTEAEPSTAGISKKPTTPLESPDTGPAPAPVPSAGAAPKSAPESKVSLEAGSKSLDDTLAQDDVTEEQLSQSNEPEFNAALKEKGDAQADAAAAPGEFRKDEEKLIASGKADAAALTVGGLHAMHKDRESAVGEVAGKQGDAKSEDEKKRADFANELETIYGETKRQVEDRLASLDKEVDDAFEKGAAEAQQSFEEYVGYKMDVYKDDRYGQLGGSVLWAKDKLFGMPDEVNAFYVEGRDQYVKDMDRVLDHVATVVETGLTDTQALIDAGRQKVADKVEALGPDEKQLLGDAIEKISSKFDKLEQAVKDKQDQLIDSLARKYTDKLGQIDKRIEEMKAANRGLVDKAIDAIKGVIETIRKLKDMLVAVVKKAAGVVGKIVKHPIDFLGHLIDGVGLGIQNFVKNLGQHLKEALMGWLFGELATAGIELPKTFDLKGLLGFVLQVLGLTYSNIRARAVTIVGEPIVKALETGAEIFKILITEGPAGLWEWLKEKLSDFKDTVLGEIESFVVDKIIVAGVTWVLSLLNPASAFIKACKAIYDIVMFFVERGSQILALVNAILDSLNSIADGAIQVAADFVEKALARALPVVIGFLASLLGIGGIGEKLKSIIEKIRAPVNKAIDWLINKAVALVKAVGNLLFGKKEEEAPKSDDPEHDAKVQKGLAEIDELDAAKQKDGAITKEDAQAIADKVRSENPVFKSINLVDGSATWDYDYVASPGQKKKGPPKAHPPLLPEEGTAGTYTQLGSTGDELTPHHMPQSAYMKQRAAPGYTHSGGICILMYHPLDDVKSGRHYLTRTYSGAPRLGETPVEALENDIADVRAIYANQGLLTARITTGLGDARQMNLKKFPTFFI